MVIVGIYGFIDLCFFHPIVYLLCDFHLPDSCPALEMVLSRTLFGFKMDKW